MTLTLAERKRRATRFIERFADAVSEEGEKQTFYNEFFEIFGKDRRMVAQYEKAVKRLPGTPPGKIDLLWPRVLLVEHKSAGKDLDVADNQADDYYMSLNDDLRPRYILTSDFKKFHLRDIDKDDAWEFTLNNLPDKIDLFSFMIGKERRTGDEEEVSIKAAELMDNVYESMKSTGYNQDQMGLYLTRLAYCMFAEDSGIFVDKDGDDKDRMFVDYITNKTEEDGTDLGMKLDSMFDTLNKSPNKRQPTLNEDLQIFPWINGGLFNERLDTAHFTKESRNRIIAAADFNWRYVSPAVFGSMFEGIMDKEERRETGSHYTSTENVLKVINPLFMDDLHMEFNEIIKSGGGKKIIEKRMIKFQNKLSKLQFLDPACGSGSFLITAYKELRKLELDVIRIIYKNKSLDKSSILSKIDVDQFHGIELKSFPVRITETAMWMADHLMNMELVKRYEGKHIRIPLAKSPHIHQADALEVDWDKILSVKCDYVFGNPPFGGARTMDDHQKKQLVKITKANNLDYVSSWFVKAAEYSTESTKIGFVASSSLTQGEQVSSLWPTLLDKHRLNIIFAYKPFQWDSDVKGSAAVAVVIIGLSKTNKRKRFFTGYTNEEINPKYISPYMICSSKQLPIVKRTSNILNGLPQITQGCRVTDGGKYTFTEKEQNIFLKKEPNAKKFFRLYIDGKDFLNGSYRYMLYLKNITPFEQKSMPELQKCIDAVKEFREKRTRPETKKFADYPKEYTRPVIPEKRFLALSRVSSERREYLPIAYLDVGTIPSDALMISEGVRIELVGLLSSKMHMVWIKTIGGRLEKRLRYSNTVYNTFPIPKDITSLKIHTQKIFDMRDKHFSKDPNTTLSHLYDPKLMPTDLRKAHYALDKAVDCLYRKELFESDDSRIEFLLGKYEKMILGGQKQFPKPKKIKPPKKIKTPKTPKRRGSDMKPLQ